MNLGGIVPRDLYDAHGGNIKDWHWSCGTGPYMLTDFVEGASATLARNPDYWMHDPLHPENQLPYLDGVKHLIIPDASTRLAAMRTAKIDRLGSYWTPLTWEDADSLMKTNPELKYVGAFGSTPPALFMRIDKDNLPLKDIKVRQALSMCFDHQAMANSMYGGKADLLNWLVPDVAEYKKIYTPIEQLPEGTRALFEYHPDEAKKLLADAGYPNGFKTSIVCQQADVDQLSVIKDYWSKIGVTLNIDVKEFGVYTALQQGNKYEEMIKANLSFQVEKATNVRVGNRYNYSFVNDPWINEKINFLDMEYWNPDKQDEVWKAVQDLNLYALEKAFFIQLPNPRTYTFWQPWVKEYDGSLGSCYTIVYDTVRYTWIDQDLKEQMTGKR
jgi:peptide/nickel transport system substrate-binding protein